MCFDYTENDIDRQIIYLLIKQLYRNLSTLMLHVIDTCYIYSMLLNKAKYEYRCAVLVGTVFKLIRYEVIL